MLTQDTLEWGCPPTHTVLPCLALLYSGEPDVNSGVIGPLPAFFKLEAHRGILVSLWD